VTSLSDEPECGSLWSLWVADVRGMVVDRGRGRIGYGLSVIAKVVLYPRLQAVLLFRLGHAAYRAGWSPVAFACQAAGLVLAGAEIDPAAVIGPGLCLVHSSGIVIGDRARIGAHFVCFHGVTIGDSGKGDGQPRLGDWVTASAGAKLLGGITVGHRAVIGANAVLLVDVPDGGVAVGMPARVVKVKPLP
jgi:serine O-acetyltransferase